MLFGPSFRRDFVDLVVGHVREAGEDVPEVGIRVQTPTAATLDDRVIPFLVCNCISWPKW